MPAASGFFVLLDPLGRKGGAGEPVRVASLEALPEDGEPRKFSVLATRVDAGRDVVVVENTPIDYLDFASPVAGLGSKMGVDATHKWPGETAREWGRTIRMDAQVLARVAPLVARLIKRDE